MGRGRPAERVSGMLYETVFEISDVGFKYLWLPALGAIFAALGGLFAYVPKLAAIRLPLTFFRGSPRRIGVFMLIFGLCWTVASFVVTNGEYVSLIRAFEAGNYKVVEGPVQDFHPKPYTGKGNESFEVGGMRFEYSEFELKAAHNTTTVHAGPIEDGLFVRVAYIGNKILRLEIRK